ncbi:STAS domain-containing protein [Desulfovibrio sp. ZJ369]|uniref:STAS domain-containing protein n=1 Tax=Desulfovibrio sp. ZJ369 TaxID=2709793 RepID=UPI0013ED1FEF|nr:STAS domain-containing protein [Desulfovibrio sp. ZJ369]
MFTLFAESHRDVTIVRLSGDMLLADVAQLNQELDQYLLAPDVSQIVLDLSRIERVDTSGLGVLVSESTKVRNMGRRLILLTPSPQVAQLLKEAEIEGFFPTFESEEELNGYIPNAAE